MENTSSKLRRIASAGIIIKAFVWVVALIPCLVTYFISGSTNYFVIWCHATGGYFVVGWFICLILTDHILYKLLKCPACNFKLTNGFPTISDLSNINLSINYCAHCGKPLAETFASVR